MFMGILIAAFSRKRRDSRKVMVEDKYRLPLHRNTRSVRDLSRIDLAEQSGVDGGVAVLARHNDEGVVVEALGFQFTDNSPE